MTSRPVVHGGFVESVFLSQHESEAESMGIFQASTMARMSRDSKNVSWTCEQGMTTLHPSRTVCQIRYILMISTALCALHLDSLQLKFLEHQDVFKRKALCMRRRTTCFI